jgi:RHS repeat-associated protein
VDAARLISQAFVLQDLFRNPDLDPLQHERRTIAALAIKWGADQLTDNACVLTGPDGANGAFVKLPGGRFSRSARIPWDLIENPDGSIILDGRAGEELHFEEVVSAEGDSSWRLASWKDGNGNTLALTYDVPGPEGKLQEVTDAVGRTLTFAYTGNLVTSVTDPAGRVHGYGYDANGNLTTHTDPRGTLTPENPNDYVTTYAYGSNPDQHLLTSITDPEGNTYLANTYDGDGRVTQQRDGRLNDTLFYYGDHLTRIVDPLGNDRVVSWTDDGRLQRETDEAGFTTTSHFDASGNLVKLDEPEEATSTFAYDPDDNLIESTDPLGNLTELEYDDDSRVTLVRDPELHETTFDYEGGPNLKRTINALGQVTRFEYYLPSGRLKDIFEPLTDANTHMTYDSFGNPKTVTNDELETTTFYYNAVDERVGHRTSETDHLGNTTSYEYDPAGNTTKVTDPLGHATDFEYDGNNLLWRVTDPKGRVTEYDYDPMNNVDLITRADTTTIDFGYDANNQLATVIDPRGNPWTVERNDPRGLVTAEVDSLGNRREFEYDGLGRLHKRTDAEERVTDYVWDAASRLTDVLYDDGTAVHNTYTDDGLLDTSSYKDWNVDYAYDALDRVIVEDYPYLGRRVEHKWDQAPALPPSPGDRAVLGLKVGGTTKHAVTYEYDGAHRLKVMTDDTGVTSYDYDDAGRLRTATLPNGASIEQTYDEASRILSVVNRDAGGDPFATFQYFDPDPSSPLYDEADNVTGVVHITPQSSLTTHYTYDVDPLSPLDDLDRLREEQTPRGTVAYTYDAAGNRETRTDAAGTMLYTYDDANQLLTAGSTTYDYDNNGNLRSKTIPGIGTTTFDWDHENRLVGITPPAGPAVTLAYDPFGRQVLRQEDGGAPVHATYDGLKLLAEGAPDLSSGFVYGGGVRRMEYRRDLEGPLGVTGYAVDRLGSITNLTDAVGEPRDAYRYDAFGMAALAAGLDANAFRFGGSSGTACEPAVPGLVRMGFRYYDSEAGRFISRDPVGFLGGDVNLYTYVASNPARFVDFDGLSRGNPLAYGLAILRWLGEDYHWAQIGGAAGGAGFVVGITLVSGGTAPILGSVLASAGLGVGAPLTILGWANSISECKSGSTYACAGVAVTTGTAPFGFVPGDLALKLSLAGLFTSLSLGEGEQRSNSPDNE